MPRTYWPPPPGDSKQPPVVLPWALGSMVDLGDGAAWPRLLVLATDAGMLMPCADMRPEASANDEARPAAP